MELIMANAQQKGKDRMLVGEDTARVRSKSDNEIVRQIKHLSLRKDRI